MVKREKKGESEEDEEVFDEAENEEEDDDEEDEDEEDDDEEEEDEEVDDEVGSGDKHAGSRVKGPINMKKLTNFKDKLEKTGVVYLSRVPPYMKAQKIRQLLSKYGEIGRIYLTPEDPAIRKKRKARGGNKKQSFVDGWIEFADKGVAKSVAKMLNCRPMGGKSTSFYSADIWNLKYLSKFKWNHLTEKVAYDNQVRKQKLQAEISQAKRERDFYLDKVEQSKRQERSNDKKKRTEETQEKRETSKRKADADSDAAPRGAGAGGHKRCAAGASGTTCSTSATASSGVGGDAGAGGSSQAMRTFKQRQPLGKGGHKAVDREKSAANSESMRTVLGMVFGK